MKLIIGLGNPGKEFDGTRHNVGFLSANRLKEKWSFPDFKSEKKFEAEISEGVRNGEKTMFAKPQTFMNLSGTAVRKILDFYKLEPTDIIVIHDDLDIELGKYKVSVNSSSAGHNGVENIIEELGTQEFKRIRIGIGKTLAEKTLCQISGKDYVLQKFSGEEMEVIEKVIGEIVEREF